MSADDEWLVPAAREPLNGSDKFVGFDARVEDFWQFALGDLRMNNARGYLAEFIVAKGLGLQKARRAEWDAYDLIWDDITIEVKSSAYLQLWDQRRASKIVFTGLTGTRWHPRHDLDPSGPRYKAMVYVFCVQAATEHDRYEALRLDQWTFYVVARSKLAALGQKSVGLARVESLSGGPVAWSDLAPAVEQVGIDEARDDDGDWWM